ncbi:MAG: hypothetical protein H7144_01395 [Burkholderiales bacterium]|nr:hypothetical protein [Phycisphaerae bacterium]
MSSGGFNLIHPKAKESAQQYIGTAGPLEVLGYGIAGVVFVSPLILTHAIKIHSNAENYRREVMAYKRLKNRRIKKIQQFTVPEMLGYSDDLLAIEMSIVTPPYLLDFANARLDVGPDFSPDVMADWWDRLRERFEDRFPIIESVYYELITRCRLYYQDFKQGNIEFESNASR